MTTKSKATKRIRKVSSRGVILTKYDDSLISRESYMQLQLIIELLLHRNSDQLIHEVLTMLLTPHARKSVDKRLAITSISATDTGPLGQMWTLLDRSAHELMQELGLK